MTQIEKHPLPNSIPAEEKLSSKSVSSKASWANIVLVPLKQHAFCCGILPPLITTLFGANAGEMLHSLPAEIGLGVVVPPLVTYGTMAIEQKYHDWKNNKKDCACAHKTLTWKNFGKQAALSYLFYAATALATHAIWPHEHEHHHDHDGHAHISKQNHSFKITQQESLVLQQK